MEQLKIASLRCDNAIAISRNMKYEIFDPRVVANQGICYPVIKKVRKKRYRRYWTKSAQ